MEVMGVSSPSYSWEFRNNTGISPVVDTVSGVVARTENGASSTSEGMVFDGVDDYLELSPWEFGGEYMTVEAYVKFGTFKKWSRIFDFGDGESDDNVYLSNNNRNNWTRESLLDIDIKNIENLEKITNIFFSGKRKMINKKIKNIFNKEKLDLIKDLNLKSRPSNLKPEKYYEITELFEKI